MISKEYIDFTKDLYASWQKCKVEVSKHYQAKDHKHLSAKLDCVRQPDEEGNIVIDLVYSDLEKALSLDCPSSITVTPSNVTRTNQDAWKVIISIPYDETDLTKEFLITFIVRKSHL